MGNIKDEATEGLTTADLMAASPKAELMLRPDGELVYASADELEPPTDPPALPTNASPPPLPSARASAALPTNASPPPLPSARANADASSTPESEANDVIISTSISSEDEHDGPRTRLDAAPQPFEGGEASEDVDPSFAELEALAEAEPYFDGADIAGPKTDLDAPFAPIVGLRPPEIIRPAAPPAPESIIDLSNPTYSDAIEDEVSLPRSAPKSAPEPLHVAEDSPVPVAEAAPDDAPAIALHPTPSAPSPLRNEVAEAVPTAIVSQEALGARGTDDSPRREDEPLDLAEVGIELPSVTEDDRVSSAQAAAVPQAPETFGQPLTPALPEPVLPPPPVPSPARPTAAINIADFAEPDGPRPPDSRFSLSPSAGSIAPYASAGLESASTAEGGGATDSPPYVVPVASQPSVDADAPVDIAPAPPRRAVSLHQRRIRERSRVEERTTQAILDGRAELLYKEAAKAVARRDLVTAERHLALALSYMPNEPRLIEARNKVRRLRNAPST